MEKFELAGNLKSKTGKGAAKQLRRDGLIPGIVYGEKENLMVTVNQKDFSTLRRKAKANALLQLKTDDNKDRMVVIKELQKDVLTREILHIDFLTVSMDKKIKISVPIEETGTPIGIKMGGILTHLLREIKAECLPGNIPQSIKVDISNLEVGQTLHIRDIEIPEGTTVLENPDETICVVKLPEAEKSKEAEEAEEAAATEEAATGEAAGGTEGAPKADASKEDKEKPKEDKGDKEEKGKKK